MNHLISSFKFSRSPRLSTFVSAGIKRYSQTTRNILEISPEIQHAIQNDLPVVALESTIITHGMPFPQNFETAMKVENTIRAKVLFSSHKIYTFPFTIASAKKSSNEILILVVVKAIKLPVLDAFYLT